MDKYQTALSIQAELGTRIAAHYLRSRGVPMAAALSILTRNGG